MKAFALPVLALLCLMPLLKSTLAEQTLMVPLPNQSPAINTPIFNLTLWGNPDACGGQQFLFQMTCKATLPDNSNNYCWRNTGSINVKDGAVYWSTCWWNATLGQVNFNIWIDNLCSVPKFLGTLSQSNTIATTIWLTPGTCTNVQGHIIPGLDFGVAEVYQWPNSGSIVNPSSSSFLLLALLMLGSRYVM